MRVIGKRIRFKNQMVLGATAISLIFSSFTNSAVPHRNPAQIPAATRQYSEPIDEGIAGIDRNREPNSTDQRTAHEQAHEDFLISTQREIGTRVARAAVWDFERGNRQRLLDILAGNSSHEASIAALELIQRKPEIFEKVLPQILEIRQRATARGTYDSELAETANRVLAGRIEIVGRRSD